MAAPSLSASKLPELWPERPRDSARPVRTVLRVTQLRADLDLYVRRGVVLEGVPIGGVVARLGTAHTQACTVDLVPALSAPLSSLADLVRTPPCPKCLPDSSDLVDAAPQPLLEEFLVESYAFFGAEGLSTIAKDRALTGSALVEALTRFVVEARLPVEAASSCMDNWLLELRSEVRDARQQLAGVVDLDELVRSLASSSRDVVRRRVGTGPVGVAAARAAYDALMDLDPSGWVLFTSLPHALAAGRHRPGHVPLTLEASVLLALTPEESGLRVLPMSTWRHLELQLSPGRLLSWVVVVEPPSREVLETMATFLAADPRAELDEVLAVAQALA